MTAASPRPGAASTADLASSADGSGPVHPEQQMSADGLGLGLDGGGTATRWALADAAGRVLAEGAVAGISGLLLADAPGRGSLARTLAELAAEVRRHVPVWQPPDGLLLAGDPPARPSETRSPAAIVAGLTGFASTDGVELQALLAAPFGLRPDAVGLMSDIELLCRAAFPPGEGAVLYAGTGSIAAHLDADGRLHRAGGRGAVIDDAGGGHWIAREALRQVWRAEDAEPGAGQRSALGRRLFAAVGGSDWADTRAWVYGAGRGEVGMLALAVAAAAEDGDAQALALLQQAGTELARLALCMQRRLAGNAPAPLPLVLAGRVFDLHPAVKASLQAALPAGSIGHRLARPAHHQAAVLAATRDRP